MLMVGANGWARCVSVTPISKMRAPFFRSDLGFARFFCSDFISALHVLVPQVENSLRYVLKQAAVDPSSIKTDMTQESRTISVMLEKDRAVLEKIIGPAIVFEIGNLFDFRGRPSICGHS
jgi:hypothetical protein